MKTLQEINREITSLAKNIKDALDAGEKRTARMMQAQLEQLRFFRLYLETNPRPEAVEKMRGEVRNRIDILEKRFGTWAAGKSEPTKVLQARYNSMAGISELKSKLKALNYLCE